MLSCLKNSIITVITSEYYQYDFDEIGLINFLINQ